MSASLVGSEMCIRDRRRTQALAGLSWSSRLPARWGPRSGWGGGGWPVSYTHLTLPTICSV
eukprot:14921115-Alexandrium_andersonii.AAC.1